MDTELDATRDKKLTLTLVGGVLVALIGGGYFLYTWLAAPAPVASRVDLNRLSSASRTQNTESPAYLELLNQYNRQGAASANNENSSFIASIPMTQQAVALPEAEAKPAVQRPTTARSSRTQQGQESKDGKKKVDPRQAALKKLMARINPDIKTEDRVVGLQTAQVLGAGTYNQWSESLPGGAKAQTVALNGAADKAYSAVEVVPPYWRGAGIIAIGVDSDNSTTPVLGKLGGPYNGAVLKAPQGAKLAGDGVVIHFTEMSFKGVNYKIDAYALKDDTLLANVATDVNHRYFTRIVLPAVLGGIGNISDLYTQANTSVVSNGFSTEIARPDNPDGTAVAGAILGGAASQAAKVLTDDASRIPPKQVTVTQGQVVSIQFMRGVYAGDAIAPSRSGEGVQSAIPAQALQSSAPQPPTQPRTADQWRAQTQARIEAQRSLQENQQ